ncbi:MAG: hypothetical protein N2C12_06430 [Planctomycetales bacterium]
MNTRFHLSDLMVAIVWFCTACAMTRGAFTLDDGQALLSGIGACCSVGAAIGSFSGRILTGAAYGLLGFFGGGFLAILF